MPADARLTGLVVAAHGRRGVLEASGQRHRFIIKGRSLKAACGDRVQFELRPGSEDLLVTAIEPRANVLARQPQHGHRGEVIAANLTRIVAVCATVPEPDLFLLDRYLCAAEGMGCRPVVVCNKCDLGQLSAAIRGEFEALGYPVVDVSAHTGRGIQQLTALLRGETSVLVGQSGVGKSSLVNTLVPGVEAQVGELSAGSDIGTHTTTAVLMYHFGESGRLVDAPGVRDFMPAAGDDSSVDTGFVEIRRHAAGCKFSTCTHTHEPGCTVKQAVDSGGISRRRYQSYLQLLDLVRTRAREARPQG